MHNYRILLVDDNDLVRRSLGASLEKEGYAVALAANGEEAVILLEQQCFDMVLTDLIMGELDGIGVAKKAKAIQSDIMVAILTGHGDLSSAIEALRLDVDDYILKLADPEELLFRIAMCFERLESRKKIKVYENLLSVCCVCKCVRDNATGKWWQIEDYLCNKVRVDVTSSYCPACGKKAMEKAKGE